MVHFNCSFRTIRLIAMVRHFRSPKDDEWWSVYSFKTKLMVVGSLEIILGFVSLWIAQAAGDQYYERMVQRASIIIYLSGMFEVALYRATSVAAYTGSALAGVASTIAGVFGLLMVAKSNCITLNLRVSMDVSLYFGMTAGMFHMCYCITGIRDLYIRNHGRERTPLSGPGTVERAPTRRCWIADWLCSCANINGARTIPILPRDDESKTCRKPRTDDAKTSGNLETHANAPHRPEPPCCDDNTEPPPSYNGCTDPQPLVV